MIDYDKIPSHVAIIMDGNGRWAQSKNLPRFAGHNAGMIAMKEIVKASSVLGIHHLTVYAFSTENWKRSMEEVSGIFKLLVLYVEKELKELHENNVKVKIIGDYQKLPGDAVKSIEKTLEVTKNNTGLQFNIALNYGSRDEIVRSVKVLAQEVENGKLKAEDITEDMISNYLYTAGIPDPDMIIRTSGEKRLSNYLLWQCAYSEFIFTDVLWPDFKKEEFHKAIEEYQGRKRRYGGR
ncbi:isoprenyl transferase [Sinanaerobacter chloroacetimidivorans]|uniref:Isoprenyl transferase n=1 Tax=Sinanaerobacter chloroacetimidivorans TaxID=2818044 RepID=A0A8J8B0M0_9FIRM|nr:isoprenyl transferase [Sinanaerobacter chloroacetimidivorans]MBR0596771.1 isoprenyl transferase [Sinanaerobacter chloroacetimidivorans]